MTKQRLVFGLILAAAMTGSGCAAGRAFRQGQEASRLGDWDAAVAHYTRAVQANPDSPEFKIALERAMQSAAQEHISRARQLEEKDQLDAALLEYRKAIEMDGTNRLAASRAAALERTIRERIEASRPRPRIEALREQARQGAAAADRSARTAARPQLRQLERPRHPELHRQQRRHQHHLRPGVPGQSLRIELEDVTVEEALQQIMSANQLFYKVVNPKTIIVINDRADKRQQYERWWCGCSTCRTPTRRSCRRWSRR